MSDVNTGPRKIGQLILAHPLAFTCLIALLWIVPGLIGHDPWKPDEAISIALVAHIVQTGDWIVPTLAGAPYPDAFPLYHLTAAALSVALDDLLPLHDAARLASGLYMALAFLLMALAVRELVGASAAWLGPLALLGCVGLIPPAHALSPDSAQIMAFALGLYGISLARRRSIAGGMALGCAAGIGFLSDGLLAVGAFGVSALLLPLLCTQWRTRTYALAGVVALLALLPWLVIWPALLYRTAPEAFNAWLAVSGPARFASTLGRMPVTLAYLLGVLPWFAFPALPLALWAVWVGRRELWTRPVFAVCIVLIASIALLLSLDGNVRQREALPLLVPLAVLAVPGLQALRRGASNAFWSFSILFGSIMVLMGWFEWSALELGFPAARHRHWLRQQPAYVPDFNVVVLILALALTLLWIGLVKALRHCRERALMGWSAGVAVTWALAWVMFIGYADMARSYRPVAASIRAAMGDDRACVASYNLGQPQHALLHYFAGIVARPQPSAVREGCDLLLVQGQRNAMHAPGPGWRQIWEGTRPGERRELFRLYRKE
ncbi:MAG: glycosyltransferase family 39 protein [Burkholderiales bacterium]|nr:glycosyltransferase family 39 protein [Burkholderiales bacterium]